jgi:hypothetical protein
MNRFIKHFSTLGTTSTIEEQVTKYAQENNLQIVTLAPINNTSVYVLFEEKGDNEE